MVVLKPKNFCPNKGVLRTKWSRTDEFLSEHKTTRGDVFDENLIWKINHLDFEYNHYDNRENHYEKEDNHYEKQRNHYENNHNHYFLQFL